jgi:tetratricopeptide (TPR) repeat protein
VHTEPVANVVGQAELLAAIGVVGAMIIYVRARRAGGPGFAPTAGIAALYALASLAKEHALFLPLLIGATELILPRASDRRPAARTFVMLLVVGALVLAARTAVLGSLFGEQHVVEMDASTRIWTMFRVVPEWARLLAWPARLSAEYGPQQIEIIDGVSTLGALGIALVAGVVAAFVLARTRQPVMALALAWLAVTFVPVSNLVSGVVLQERTLMLPSVGAVLLSGVAFQLAWARAADAAARYAVATLAAALVIAGAWRSAARNPIWRDNVTLFTQMVQDAPRSYRAHYLHGSELFNAGRPADGERELRQAIALSRNDSDPYNFLATKYREARLYSHAIPLYREALKLRPTRPDSRFGLALSLLESGDVAGARAHADTGLANGQLKSYFMWVRSRADSVGAASGARWSGASGSRPVP